MGRLRGARAHVDAATANADETGLMPARLWSLHAALRLAAARADHAEVARLGDRLVADGYDALPEGVHHWRATYVDALEALGRVDDAAGVARELAGRSGDPADASVAADAARAAGVVAAAQGRDGDAVAAFESGLALDVVASRPFERARLELAAGAHLRRAGNRRAAAALLGRALARCESLGAAPWATRCGREAAACGLRPRRRAQPDATGALTTQERLVARLVAQGGTNREVAAELVISAKTVEHHLGRVYGKLGLRSRTELAARLAADAAGGADPATGEAAGGHGEPGGDVGREGAP
jgi:DNA-binding NarL/FixJ family response regulator